MSRKLDYRRLKSSRGRYPVEGALIAKGQDGTAAIVFDFPASPKDAPAAPFDVETLASLLPNAAMLSQDAILSRFVETALLTGPLFGDAADEAVADWECEVRIAQCALTLQEIINGDKPVDFAMNPVDKIVVSRQDDGSPIFSSYFLSLPMGLGAGRLEGLFPAMPWMKRFAASDTYDYVFAVPDEDDSQRYLDLILVSFPGEISAEGYTFLVSYFQEMQLELAGVMQQEEGFTEDDLMPVGQASIQESALDAADLPQLQRLVHAIITLHLQGIHVDLFKSDGSSDFLAFENYLSSLWYDFAMHLGAVKVGYCSECGRGFSLTGHRGMEREYCSEQCRAKARNERRRVRVEQSRKDFLEGKSVNEIARGVYGDMALQPALDQVRKNLSTWPKLKQAVRKSMAEGDGAFVRRCLQERAVDEDFVRREASALLKRRR